MCYVSTEVTNLTFSYLLIIPKADSAKIALLQIKADLFSFELMIIFCIYSQIEKSSQIYHLLEISNVS